VADQDCCLCQEGAHAQNKPRGEGQCCNGNGNRLISRLLHQFHFFASVSLTFCSSSCVSLIFSQGIANALGNKGAVGVSFFVGTTSLCFVNCHLAAGAEKVSPPPPPSSLFHGTVISLFTTLPSGPPPPPLLSLLLTLFFCHVVFKAQRKLF
jgi:hypothetical protein